MPRRAAEDPTPRLVRIDGRRSWYIRWTEPGTRRSQVRSCSTEDEPTARLILAEFKARLHAPPATPTITWYLDARAKKFRTKDADGQTHDDPRIRSFQRPLRAFFGDYRPDQLTTSLIQQYVDGRPLSAARREVEELRAAIPPSQRACDFPLPAPRPPRERFMDREEGRQLLAAAKTPHIRLFILLGLTTGQRAGAILDLTWDRVLWDSRVLDFRNPDKGENRKRRGVCPVDGRVMAALQEAHEVATTGHVIEFGGSPVESVKKAFERTAINAGLCAPTGEVDAKGKPIMRATVSPHIMKHSVISWLAMDDWTIDQISDFTSTDAKTVKRIYRKVNPGYLRDLASSLSDGLWGAPTPSPVAGSSDTRLHRRHNQNRSGGENEA